MTVEDPNRKWNERDGDWLAAKGHEPVLNYARTTASMHGMHTCHVFILDAHTLPWMWEESHHLNKKYDCITLHCIINMVVFTFKKPLWLYSTEIKGAPYIDIQQKKIHFLLFCKSFPSLPKDGASTLSLLPHCSWNYKCSPCCSLSVSVCEWPELGNYLETSI